MAVKHLPLRLEDGAMSAKILQHEPRIMILLHFWLCLNRFKVRFESLVKLYGSFRAKWLLKKYVRVQSSWKSTLHKVHFLYHGPFYTCCNFCRLFLQFVNYAVSDLWSRLSHLSIGKSDFELNRTVFFVCWQEYFISNSNQK